MKTSWWSMSKNGEQFTKYIEVDIEILRENFKAKNSGICFYGC